MTQEFTLETKHTNFIGCWFLEDLSVCDDLIDFFKNNKNLHRQGVVGNVIHDIEKGDTMEEKIDHNIKHSIDLPFYPQDNYQPWVKYHKELFKVIDLYKEKYYWCDQFGTYAIVEGTNVQFYPPGGGYKKWHTERAVAGSDRHLVFMTYLNDVNDEGQTEFYHQEIGIQPKKGLTVIWPADWTHTHRGVPSMTQEKYIITGWLNYV